MQLALAEANHTEADLQEKLAQSQKALTSSDHERRLLQERLDNAKYR